MGHHTATHCHCGAHRKGSDHCPECGCEEFETVCDHVAFGVAPEPNEPKGPTETLSQLLDRVTAASLWHREREKTESDAFREARMPGAAARAGVHRDTWTTLSSIAESLADSIGVAVPNPHEARERSLARGRMRS